MAQAKRAPKVLPEAAFLMVVTPRDCPIALYSVPPLGRLVDSSPNFRATIYCNGLSAEQVKSISGLVEDLDRITIRDNSEYLASIRDTIRLGGFQTRTGGRDYRQGFYETPTEIWSRELLRLKSDFVIMIDADFEIFDNEFVNVMLSEIAIEQKLAFYSTEYSRERKTFETYAQEEAIIAERWHTWFCVYRRAALEKCHDFSYVEERKDGLPLKYDNSAMLQKVLINDYGYVGRSLRCKYLAQYLHYGAFAQNRSLKDWRLRLYRVVRIAKHNGWRHKVRLPLIAEAVRLCGSAVWKMSGLAKFDVERSRFAVEGEIKRDSA